MFARVKMGVVFVKILIAWKQFGDTFNGAGFEQLVLGIFICVVACHIEGKLFFGEKRILLWIVVQHQGCVILTLLVELPFWWRVIKRSHREQSRFGVISKGLFLTSCDDIICLSRYLWRSNFSSIYNLSIQPFDSLQLLFALIDLISLLLDIVHHLRLAFLAIFLERVQLPLDFLKPAIDHVTNRGTV